VCVCVCVSYSSPTSLYVCVRVQMLCGLLIFVFCLFWAVRGKMRYIYRRAAPVVLVADACITLTRTLANGLANEKIARPRTHVWHDGRQACCNCKAQHVQGTPSPNSFFCLCMDPGETKGPYLHLCAFAGVPRKDAHGRME